MTATSQPIIRLQDVVLSYRIRKQIFSKTKKEVNALRALNMSVFRGEKLGVLGRNGAGKSTLFKLLAGIFEPDGGEIYIEPSLNVQLLSLGLGFEGNLTGRENAILNGMLLGKSRKFVRTRLEAIKEFSGLGDFFEMPVYTYSSGMNARLGFSVAMEVDPDVLLVDEVLGVGDADFARKSQAAMHDRFDSDRTIVLVSHDHEVIRSMCDRCVWIESGETVMEGAADEVIAAYLDSVAGA